MTVETLERFGPPTSESCSQADQVEDCNNADINLVNNAEASPHHRQGETGSKYSWAVKGQTRAGSVAEHETLRLATGSASLHFCGGDTSTRVS